MSTRLHDDGGLCVESDGRMYVQLADRRLRTGSHLEILGGISKLNRCQELVLDLRRVWFLSQTAISRLIELNRQVERAGGHLILRHLNHKLRRAFEITKLDVLFDIEDERDDLRTFRELSYAETFSPAANGNTTVNVLPSPGRLEARTVPCKA